MKPLTNWKNQEEEKEFQKLPADGYICKIMGAKVNTFLTKGGRSCEQLVVSIDIADGEFVDFYANDYRNQQQEDKKWKGNLRLYIPNEDNPGQYEESTRRKFKSFTNVVEDSNPGYSWNWDEATLKGKKIGILFRIEQWVMDGREGWKTQPFKPVSVLTIEDGNFTIPKEKPHKDAIGASNEGFTTADALADEDLPF